MPRRVLVSADISNPCTRYQCVKDFAQSNSLDIEHIEKESYFFVYAKKNSDVVYWKELFKDSYNKDCWDAVESQNHEIDYAQFIADSGLTRV